MKRIEGIGGILLLAVAFWLTGCHGKAEPEQAEKQPVAAPAAKPAVDNDSVELEPAMLANVKLEPARQQALPRLLAATGKVQFNEERMAKVLAPLPGQVLDLRLRVGDAVTKDQVLFSIRSREVAALVTDYLQAQRDQDLATRTLTMTRDLFEHQAASRIALQQAEADVTKNAAQVARAEEGLRVLGLDSKQAAATTGLRTLVPVRSPLAGTVIEKNVTEGQFLQADATALLTLADLSTVWVMVDVFEKDLHLVHTGQRVLVTATAYADRRFTAHVERINDRIDPETRTVKVRLLVSNSGGLLKPEMFIAASLVLNESTQALTIPASALIAEGDRTYAFVAGKGLRFERRLITGAPDSEGHVRVASGIAPGDRVVADGALLMRFRQKQQQEPE